MSVKSNLAMGILASVVSINTLTLTGCGTEKKRTAIGAGTGAATGAAVGGVVRGWKGAAIGGAVGAAAGGLIGRTLDKQAEELQKVAETKRTEEGILVHLRNDLLFQTNSAVLKPEAITKISELGDVLAKYPEDKVRVEGYTDNVGKESYNEVLSLRRAQAVKNIMISRGVTENQITTIGLGMNRPIGENATTDGRALNRRVEIHIAVPEKTTS